LNDHGQRKSKERRKEKRRQLHVNFITENIHWSRRREGLARHAIGKKKKKKRKASPALGYLFHLLQLGLEFEQALNKKRKKPEHP